VFWGSIAQMCYYIFRVWGKYRTNVLLRVSCFGEVLHKCRKYFAFLGGTTKMSDMCTGISTAQMCETKIQYVFSVPGNYRKNIAYVSCSLEVSLMWLMLSVHAVLPTFVTHAYRYIAADSRLLMRSCSLEMQITMYTASLPSMQDASPRCVT